MYDTTSELTNALQLLGELVRTIELNMDYLEQPDTVALLQRVMEFQNKMVVDNNDCSQCSITGCPCLANLI